jgi:hypothetical protein
MKTTIRFFAALAIVTGFTLSAKAQTTANAGIGANAVVTAGVTVTAGTALDFKNVVPGVAKTIDLKNTVTAGTATGSETTGYWTITKGANTQVTVDIDVASTTYLVGVTNTNHLPIASYAARFREGGTAAAPSNESAWSAFTGNATANSGGTIPFYTASSFIVDLGATVSPIALQAADTYSGTFTLTATYN